MKTQECKDRIIAAAKARHGGYITRDYEKDLLSLPEGFDIKYDGYGDIIETTDDEGDEVIWDDDNDSWSKVNT